MSTRPSQSLSIPSQTSVAPGFTERSPSSQLTEASYPSPSASVEPPEPLEPEPLEPDPLEPEPLEPEPLEPEPLEPEPLEPEPLEPEPLEPEPLEPEPPSPELPVKPVSEPPPGLPLPPSSPAMSRPPESTSTTRSSSFWKPRPLPQADRPTAAVAQSAARQVREGTRKWFMDSEASVRRNKGPDNYTVVDH